MKKLFPLYLFSVLALAGCQPAEKPPEKAAEPVKEEPAPAAANRATTEATVGGAHVVVNYGTPELKGRDMLSKLPDGGVWRLGMNEATTLETDRDLAFGETVVKAGKYSIWARKVKAGEWRLIFNSEPDIWGTARKAENDLVDVPLESSTLENSVEKFSIQMTDAGQITMQWGALQLQTTFTAH